MEDPQDKSLGSAGYLLMPFLRIAQRLKPGASLREELQRTGYARSRPAVTAEEVRAVLAAHPSLLEAWLAYSQHKDTPDGWYVLPDAEIGQLQRPSAQRHFATIEEAVAEFVIRELDHNAGLAAAAGPAPRGVP